MKDLKAKGVLTSYQWPKDVIPNAVNAEVNQASIQRIAALREPLVTAMREQGFSDQGVSLDQKVLNAMANDAPEGYGALVETFLSQSSDGKYHLAGTVLTKQPVTVETLETLAPLIAKHHTVTGWPVLQATLLPLVKRDLFWIFLPAAGLLLVMLWFIFHSVRDAAAAIAVLVSALLLVNIWVSLTESSWNFLSVMAIPLIIGTGIDYSIHLVFALRRYNGDFHKVWNGVGKAICFCGLSTAIGFGSLLFASNETLRSMGMLCGLGVLLTTVLSVTVLPGLWQRCRH
jgi:predicted RND superfamily exporter protein